MPLLRTPANHALLSPMPAAPVTILPSAPAAQAVAAGPNLGPYPAAGFRVTDGLCTDCPAIPQALWYFRRETIAVPQSAASVATFATGVRFDVDLRAWVAGRGNGPRLDYPSLVWIAAPHIISGASLAAGATTLDSGAGTLKFTLTPKIPLNRSYFDATSARFFAARTIKVRGNIADGGIVARTLWPEDFRLADTPAVRALSGDASPAAALRERMREESNGGARSPYAAETLWQRAGIPPDLRGRAVLAFMVNGAQGDDDEALGGHFALVTGRIQNDGAIGDWLVNNFYTLDAESEKGIIGAVVPLDNYLADLNAGQSWYRPSCMVVAVLSDERAMALVQSALGRVYNQFYRHQLVYYHPSMNCTSISVDTLRALGWHVRVRGPTSRLVAWAGFPLIAAKERSVAKARIAYDYLYEDQTRLLPAAALEEIVTGLVGFAAHDGTDADNAGPLARMLAHDLDAIIYLRFPQFPSSRAWGDAPAATTWEYRMRIPQDPAMAQIIPLPPRPFPDALRDADLLPPPQPPSAFAALIWGVLSIVGIPWVARTVWRRWRTRHRAGSS
jgi:hypothetical protein